MSSFSAKSFTRRQFVHGAALGLAAGAFCRFAPRLSAATAATHRFDPTEPRALVLVHLEGGNDGLNTIVPFHDDEYHRLRPTLALASHELVTLSSTTVAHRAAAPFERLFKDGKLAIIPHVGCASPNSSHFRATEIWQTAAAPDEPLYSGWAGRSLSHLQAESRDVRGFYSSPLMPRIFVREEDRADLSAPSTPFRAPLSDSILDSAAQLAAIGERAAASPATEIYFVSVPGFDTHFHQADRHAARLQSVSSALLALQTRLEQRGVAERVLTLVYSEFGRTAAENSQAGTDHAASGPVFLLGSSARGGLHSPRVSRAEPPVDFRRVLQPLVTQWLNVPASAVFTCDPGGIDLLQPAPNTAS